jgi:dynein heavy chain, axonemal
LQELIKRFVEDLNLKGLIFNVDEIKNKIDAEQKGPYQNVFIQEIEYMTILLIEIVKSLEEIDQGLKGNLTISEKMEQTMDALVLNRVPTSWNALGYPSKRGLESWVINLVKRIEQLDLFKNEPLNLPKVIMISRFFNPQSYLTAIKQVVAANQKGQGLELNKLYIQTDITKKTIEEIDVVPKDGAYVFGFILEGARWDPGMGMLDESKPKEMFSVIPVVFCRAAVIPAEGKEDKSLYQCPAYKTEDRGSTYVFTAQLKTKVSPRKWILAGVAIIMDVEGVSDESTAKKKEEKK